MSLRWLALPLLAGAGGLVLAGAGRPTRLADADDFAQVGRGKQVYAERCASCHGRLLQGQPLWRVADADQPRRAPAQDGTGPGWRHSDAELFAAVRDGHFPDVAANPRSRMPAFGMAMPESDIWAVLAFTKARWPVSLRVMQAALTPGGRMPRDAAKDWRFPADCRPQ